MGASQFGNLGGLREAQGVLGESLFMGPLYLGSSSGFSNLGLSL